VAGGGIRRLQDAGIEVEAGLLAAEARALNAGFFSRFERGRPFVRLKLAMSLDGRTGSPAGGRIWITGEAARADVQEWRARSSAVLTGAGTVRADDPRLDVRLAYGPWVRQPLRVVLDTDLTCPPDAAVFRGAATLVFAAVDAARVPSREAAAPAGDGRRIERVARTTRGLDLTAILTRLAALEINEVLAECGARLAGALLEADLVDELVLYVAPHLLGAHALPLAAVAELGDAARLPHFEFREQRMFQNDLRLVLTPKRA
jgi:diaminohydroxyphosphoribosylaminopyrimidine deaminase/5-amino-6-(5-phosphoribosylamino)uracil reductase